MTRREALSTFQMLLDYLEGQKRRPSNPDEARDLAVCFTHTEDAMLRFKDRLVPDEGVGSNPAMLHVKQLEGVPS